MVQSHGRQDLKKKETERETDAILDRWGCLSSTMGNIGVLSEPNDGLMEM